VQHPSATDAPPRVLIVDDDEDSVHIYSQFLELAGYATTPAYSAMSAYTSARRSPPSAVLLDLVLPDMHGTELARLFRCTPGLEQVPFVGVTARVTAELLEAPETLEVGRLLVKPATSHDVVAAIRETIGDPPAVRA
jgi:CheY-like chemotaxis protein